MVATRTPARWAETTRRAARGSKIASENRRIVVRPDTCAGPPAGTGPETLDPAAAVAPRNSELLLIDWTWPLDDLGLAVVADPVRAEVEAGQQEDAGLLQLGEGLANPLLRDGDVQVPRAPESQGAGQVDRLDHLARAPGGCPEGPRPGPERGRRHRRGPRPGGAPPTFPRLGCEAPAGGGDVPVTGRPVGAGRPRARRGEGHQPGRRAAVRRPAVNVHASRPWATLSTARPGSLAARSAGGQ